eukprot:GHUV01035294.1.p2 GENE.GHUV01035294.1~~GHUV01035294.1.p2  ORF type:complete len:101 (-),score=12.31 GHUV01035294.1:854-1111(-)
MALINQYHSTDSRSDNLKPRTLEMPTSTPVSVQSRQVQPQDIPPITAVVSIMHPAMLSTKANPKRLTTTACAITVPPQLHKRLVI